MNKVIPIVIAALGIGIGAYYLFTPEEQPIKPEPEAKSKIKKEHSLRKGSDPTPAETTTEPDEQPDPIAKEPKESDPKPDVAEPEEVRRVSLATMLELFIAAYRKGDFATVDTYRKEMQVYAPLSKQPEFTDAYQNASEYTLMKFLAEALQHEEDGDFLWAQFKTQLPNYAKFNQERAHWLEGESDYYLYLAERAPSLATKSRGGVNVINQLLEIFAGTDKRYVVLVGLGELPKESRAQFVPLVRKEMEAFPEAAPITALILMKLLPDDQSRLAVLDDPRLKRDASLLLSSALMEKVIGKEEATKRVAEILTTKKSEQEGAVLLEAFAHSYPKESLALARNIDLNGDTHPSTKQMALAVLGTKGEEQDRQMLLNLALEKGELAYGAAAALTQGNHFDETKKIFESSEDASLKKMVLPVLVEKDRAKYLPIALEPTQSTAVRKAAISLLSNQPGSERQTLRGLGESDDSSGVRLAALRRLYEDQDPKLASYFEERAKADSDPTVRSIVNSMAIKLRKLAQLKEMKDR